MPFVKPGKEKVAHAPNEHQKIFVGRASELHFFSERILQPDDPACNIVSIYGDGGVGKSTLIDYVIAQINTPPYQEYCLHARVDERQVSIFAMLEALADQLRLRREFKKARASYRAAAQHIYNNEQDSSQDAVLQHAPDLAGAILEGIPFIGPAVGAGVKIAAEQAVRSHQENAKRQALNDLSDPLRALTRAFLVELNRLADTLVTVTERGGKRHRRVLLFFDDYEQLADRVAPWLLDQFLMQDISNNIVLVISGRVPLIDALPDERKRWQPYIDDENLASIELQCFTESETRQYLVRRGITDPAQCDRIWHLSHGLPLYLSLLTSHPEHAVDPTADVVENFLRWIPEQEEIKRRLVLDAALFTLPFNQDDLSAFPYLNNNIAPHTQTSLYRWLIKQPFVQKELHHSYHTYHDLVSDLFCRYLFQRSPESYYATRRQLIHYYEHRMERLLERGGQEIYHEEQWPELVLALVQQLFFCPDTASHCTAIERLLETYDRTSRNEEIVAALHELTQDQPDYLVNLDARQTVQIVLDYLEAEPVSEEFVHAASALIEKASRSASFSAALLARLYGLRGFTFRKLNQPHKALSDLNRALALNPTYIWACAQRGITYRELKQYTEALNDFQYALEADNSLDWVYTARGETYRKIKEYERALADFNRALELDPDYAIVYAGRGRVHYALQQYEQALTDFDKAISIDPELEWVYAHRGNTYRQLKQYSLAIADYTKATELNPSYFWAYAQLGETYRQLKNYKSALEAYNSSISIDPDYAWARASRAFVYFSLKDYQRALTDYDRAIALNPDYTWAYGQRGKTYRHMKNYLHAITDFDRALELDPNDAWAYSHRGLCYFSLGDYQQAIADIDRAIKLQPQRAQFYGHRGSAYLGLSDLVQARADYARNCELNPADLRACWTYEWIELCEHRADETTIHRLEAIAAREPQHAIAHLCRGLTFWLKQRSQRALTELDTAQKLRPAMWDSAFWRGMIVAAGGHDDAARHWQHALELGMPPVLLAPLCWLEDTQPEIYHRDAEPLLQSNTMPLDEAM